MVKDTNRYVVTDDARLIEQMADLDRERHTGQDGHRITEASTEEYTEKRAANLGGRPTLNGKPGSSPQVVFRISQELREHAEKIAAQEGRTVSAIAREALEEYVSRR